MNKTALKFFGGALLLVLAGAGAVWGIDYYQKIHSPEYQAQLKFQELEARAKADTYGGSTPEETLALFVDALKKGDIDLASKYFVVDEQEKEREVLSQTKSSNKLLEIINRLQQFKSSKQDAISASFIILDKEGILKYQASFTKNQNDKWKILDL